MLLPNVYHNPKNDPVCKLTDKELQEGFDAVYEDLYCELSKFGHLVELHVRFFVAILFSLAKLPFFIGLRQRGRPSYWQCLRAFRVGN
jgi:hypothetical protein